MVSVVMRDGSAAGAHALLGLVRSLPCYLTFCLLVVVTVPSVGLPAVAPAPAGCLATGRVIWRRVPLAPRRGLTPDARGCTRMIEALRDPALRAKLTRSSGEEDATGRERSVLAIGIRLAIVAALVQSVVHLLNLALFDLDIDALDVDSDTGAFTWASSVATFGAALFVTQLWILRAHAPHWALLTLALVLAFFSFDDALALHERVSSLETEFAGIKHFSRIFWPLVFMPLLGGALVGLWALSTQLRRRPALTLRAGLALLVAAVGLEMMSPALFALGFDHGDLGYELEAVLEEGAELAGWILVATGLAAGAFQAAARASVRRA